MKYVYDILLNFNEWGGYEFYEWYPDDDIEYYKRIPLIRIDDNTYKKISVGSILENKDFLDKIYNVAEVYDKKRVRNIDYACLVTNGKEVIALLLNKEGKILMISKLLIDEAEESVDIGNSLTEETLSILCNIQRGNDVKNYLTRYERRKLFLLQKEIDNLYNSKNIVKLKYFYYEINHHMEDDVNILYKKIKMFLEDEWSSKHDDLYNLVRLSYSKK